MRLQTLARRLRPYIVETETDRVRRELREAAASKDIET